MIEKNNDAGEYFERGCTLLENGRQNESAYEFKRALDFDRDKEYHSIINYKLGLFYYTKGKEILR